jgi:hypothetical protein
MPVRELGSLAGRQGQIGEGPGMPPARGLSSLQARQLSSHSTWQPEQTDNSKLDLRQIHPPARISIQRPPRGPGDRQQNPLGQGRISSVTTTTADMVVAAPAARRGSSPATAAKGPAPAGGFGPVGSQHGGSNASSRSSTSNAGQVDGFPEALFPGLFLPPRPSQPSPGTTQQPHMPALPPPQRASLIAAMQGVALDASSVLEQQQGHGQASEAEACAGG